MEFIRAFVAAGLIAALALASGCARTAQDAGAFDDRAALLAATEAASPAAASPAWRCTPEAILETPGDTAADAFSLNAGVEAPILNPLERWRIIQAAGAIEERGACSFVFLNLETGLGIAHRAGTDVYTASSSKAPLACYALLQARQPGQELAPDDRANIEAAIKASSNDAFDALALSRQTPEYETWLAAHGVQADFAGHGPYLVASARGMASLWAEIARYLDADGEDAAWFAGLLADTNRSYIRDGVALDGAAVLNKGGWIDGAEDDSTSDAALITLGGQSYLMVILTGQEPTDEAQQRVAHLAKLLFAQREMLEPRVR